MDYRTNDGFISYSDGRIDRGLLTFNSETKRGFDVEKIYDVIVVGAGFAGLISARELTLRNRSVALVEARDRIGGRTLTTKIDDEQFEIGANWIHWSQPHIWSEMTRYGLSLTESQGASPTNVTLLLDQGKRRKVLSADEIYPKLFRAIEYFSNVDGFLGRQVFPLPHKPLTNRELVAKYDQLSVQDRLNEIDHILSDDEDVRQLVDAFLSMNTQTNLTESGFIDHLCFWALGDYDTDRTWEKTSRYKIREGIGTLTKSILNDCSNLDLFLSTSIKTIEHDKDNYVRVHTQSGEYLTGRTAIITVPLNALQSIEFQPALSEEKWGAIHHGQCRGGIKFWAKLVKPVGPWCGFAAHPNPITVAYTDDTEGRIIVGFGPDDMLNIENIHMVEKELRKFIPDCEVECVFGHKWRDDPNTQSTWSYYRPGQMSKYLEVLQKSEGRLFFASGDISNSWRGCIDGAIESGLTVVRHVLNYL